MNDASQRVDANTVETVQRRQQTDVYISRLSAVIRLCADIFPEGKVDARTLVLCRQTNGSHQNSCHEYCFYYLHLYYNSFFQFRFTEYSFNPRLPLSFRFLIQIAFDALFRGLFKFFGIYLHF